jgi:3-hydroxybutyrate dehydrogenase
VGAQVNNAGIQHISSVDTFPGDAWNRVMAINLTACFQLIQATLPHMRKQAFGR